VPLAATEATDLQRVQSFNVDARDQRVQDFDACIDLRQPAPFLSRNTGISDPLPLIRWLLLDANHYPSFII
jgi:hypothetical protein